MLVYVIGGVLITGLLAWSVYNHNKYKNLLLHLREKENEKAYCSNLAEPPKKCKCIKKYWMSPLMQFMYAKRKLLLRCISIRQVCK